MLPPVWPDEVLFFSPSQELANNGILKTDVLVGLIPGMEKKTLWMPPAYMLNSALFLKIFPQTLSTVRLLSALTIFLSAITFLFLLRKLKFNNISVTIGFATIIFEPLFFRFGIPARMEGMTILFFLLSAYTTFTTKDPFLRGLISGLFFSIACLSHPFALSLGLVIIYLLYLDNPNKYRTFVYFILGAIIPFFAWLLYISPDWDLLIMQFGAQLVRKKALFSTFSLIDKIKIFSYGFAFSKIRIFLILIQLLLIGIFSRQIFKQRKILPIKFNLFWIWILSVIISIYSSSEGWYVIHFLFPFALGMSILSEQRIVGLKVAIFGILLSVTGWFQIINLHHIQTDSDQILTNHFERIYDSLKDHNRIYVQSIPDPYFYLKSKQPNKEILEFIPGELGIPSHRFLETIGTRDAFIFYRDDLKSQAISDFLIQHPDWIREEWDIPVPAQHWLAYKTIIYKKPLR